MSRIDGFLNRRVAYGGFLLAYLSQVPQWLGDALGFPAYSYQTIVLSLIGLVLIGIVETISRVFALQDDMTGMSNEFGDKV